MKIKYQNMINQRGFYFIVKKSKYYQINHTIFTGEEIKLFIDVQNSPTKERVFNYLYFEPLDDVQMITKWFYE